MSARGDTRHIHRVICVSEMMVNQSRKAMKPRNACTKISTQKRHRISIAIFSVVLVWLGRGQVSAQQTAAPGAAAPAPSQQAQSQVLTTTTNEEQPAAPIPPDQLDSLV